MRPLALILDGTHRGSQVDFAFVFVLYVTFDAFDDKACARICEDIQAKAATADITKKIHPITQES